MARKLFAQLKLLISVRTHLKAQVIVQLLVVILFAMSGSFAQATDYNSTNFITRDPIQSSYGGSSSSSSYSQTQSGGEPIIGESNSSNFILRSGFLYFDTYTPLSQNWRWYSDYSNETPATPIAAENVAPSTIDDEQIIKLRMVLKETYDIGYSNLKFKLQFSTDSTFSSGVNDLVESGSCNGSSIWCYADGGGSDNGIITTKLLSDADSCASSTGFGCGTHNESGTSNSTFTQTKSTATEFEFTLQNKNTNYNTTYYFRAYDKANDLPVAYGSGKSYPSLVTSTAGLTFAISGLTSGTSTEGITTDVTTTATTVPFGTLAVGSQIEAAQRLTVTTSAFEGYGIFIFQRQGLLSTGYGGLEITPVSGTNASPSSWAIPGGEESAYGYHPGDDTLAGGSTRFSSNNTYAKLDATAREIAYSSGPVQSESTDVVFKTQITNQQEAGQYASRLVYIVVPTF